MKSQLGFAAWILAAIVGTTGAAAGQITPSDDSYTDTATPTTNLGAKITLGVSSAAQTSFIRFDLTSIPAGYTGANIGKATLKLYVNSVATAGSFNVVYVNGSWSENTITANLSPALGGPITSNVPLIKANAKDFLLVDITSALAAWLNGSQPNDGIALVANSPLAATFETKENTAQGHSPELDVVFASGGGGTITGDYHGSRQWTDGRNEFRSGQPEPADKLFKRANSGVERYRLGVQNGGRHGHGNQRRAGSPGFGLCRQRIAGDDVGDLEPCLEHCAHLQQHGQRDREAGRKRELHRQLHHRDAGTAVPGFGGEWASPARSVSGLRVYEGCVGPVRRLGRGFGGSGRWG